MRKAARKEPGVRPQYDFSKGVCGKYSERYARGANIVLLAPDVQDVFADSESVNRALRALAKIVRAKSHR